MKTHVKFLFKLKFSCSSFCPKVRMVDPFAAKSWSEVGLSMCRVQAFGNTDTSAPVSIRKRVPEYLSLTMRRFCVWLPSSDACARDGDFSFPGRYPVVVCVGKCNSLCTFLLWRQTLHDNSILSVGVLCREICCGCSCISRMEFCCGGARSCTTTTPVATALSTR